PASLHYHSPNPHIPFDEFKFRVNAELNSWPLEPGETAIAGVSSFGFGGTNVHMIVSEAVGYDKEAIGYNKEAIGYNKDEEVNKESDSTSPICYLLPLSAHSPAALHSLAGDFMELFTADSEFTAKDICYAASVRRSQFDHRLAVIGNSNLKLHNNLQAFIRGDDIPDAFLSSNDSQRLPKLAFVFSGQGGQWYGMGRELLQHEPVFFKAIERIDQIIREKYSWSLIDRFNEDESSARFNDIDVVQPAIFAIQVALAELWQSWGIKPDAVIGHSMGEVASANVAGALSLEDAVTIVCSRSQLLKQLRGKGGMLLTALSPAQAKEVLNGFDSKIAIAVFNSPFSTVFSGDTETIKKVKNSLDRQNLFCKTVNVDVASHSPQIELLRTDVYKALHGLDPQPASLPIYSTVTGARADDLNFNADYWIDNLRKPVLFSDAIGQLLDDGYSTFIEIGPHPVLLSSIQQSSQSGSHKLSLLPSLRREEPERKILLGSLGRLYTEGFSIDWKNVYHSGGKYVNLPLIPWQRQRYWIDTKSASSRNSLQRDRNVHPLLGDRINLASSPAIFIWQSIFDDEIMNFLSDHKIENQIVFPAAAYIEMALQASAETSLNKTHELTDFVINESMIIQRGKFRSIQAVLSPDDDGGFLFGIYSRFASDEPWISHATANFIQNGKANELVAFTRMSAEVIQEQYTSHFDSAEFYQVLESYGMQYGPGFRGVQQVWGKDDEALGLINLPESLQYDTDSYQVHPALLDACLQVLAATQVDTSGHSLYLPTGCKEIRFFSKPGKNIWSHVSLRSVPTPGIDVLYADIIISDSIGQTLVELIGFRLQRTGRSIRKFLSQQNTWLYQLKWEARN
ncbi:MAG: type I polyketide synthase, partial [Chitinophagaceae bacterium]